MVSPSRDGRCFSKNILPVILSAAKNLGCPRVVQILRCAQDDVWCIIRINVYFRYFHNFHNFHNFRYFRRRTIMNFPNTSLTLIQRLVDGGSEEDWAVFFEDYWGAVCRFSLRWGARDPADAEEISSQTFEVLWENRLLVRWLSNRLAKLRTLLCVVTRNILSQRNRVQSNRDRLFRKMLDELDRESLDRAEHVDAFYSAWVEDVLQRALESLAAECYRNGNGNRLRIFYGRVCRRLTIAKVAESLKMSTAAVDHHFRQARDRLAEILKNIVLAQVRRYARGEDKQDVDEEFAQEWARLGEYLREHGGLDEAVRGAFDLFDPVQDAARGKTALNEAVDRFTTIMRTAENIEAASPPADGDSGNSPQMNADKHGL